MCPSQNWSASDNIRDPRLSLVLDPGYSSLYQNSGMGALMGSHYSNHSVLLTQSIPPMAGEGDCTYRRPHDPYPRSSVPILIMSLVPC